MSNFASTVHGAYESGVAATEATLVTPHCNTEFSSVQRIAPRGFYRGTGIILVGTSNNVPPPVKPIMVITEPSISLIVALSQIIG